MTERKAIKELAGGSEAALAWLISRYSPYATTIIHNIIGPFMGQADVEEVASDVFLALWENAGKVYSVKGFLGTTARNKAKNKLRQLGQELPLEEDILILDTPDPEALLEQKELHSAVKKAVTSMKQPDRDIFLRYYYYYQPMDVICREMDINLSTVKSRLRRGRGKLKQMLLAYLE